MFEDNKRKAILIYKDDLIAMYDYDEDRKSVV